MFRFDHKVQIFEVISNFLFLDVLQIVNIYCLTFNSNLILYKCLSHKQQQQQKQYDKFIVCGISSNVSMRNKLKVQANISCAQNGVSFISDHVAETKEQLL